MCKGIRREKLKKKFSIPVKKTKVDLLKTYCKFLIDIFKINNLKFFINKILRFAIPNREKIDKFFTTCISFSLNFRLTLYLEKKSAFFADFYKNLQV